MNTEKKEQEYAEAYMNTLSEVQMYLENITNELRGYEVNEGTSIQDITARMERVLKLKQQLKDAAKGL